MILPDKDITLKNSLIGASTKVVKIASSQESTISALWDKVQKGSIINSFGKFCLCLDLLFSLDLIEFTNGLIIVKKPK